MFLFEMLLDRAVATGAFEDVVTKIKHERDTRSNPPAGAGGDIDWELEFIRDFAGKFSIFLNSPAGSQHLQTDDRRFYLGQIGAKLATFTEAMNALPGARALDAAAREKSVLARRNASVLSDLDIFERPDHLSAADAIQHAISVARTEAANAIAVRQRLEQALCATGRDLVAFVVHGYMVPGAEAGSPVLLAALNEVFAQ